MFDSSRADASDQDVATAKEAAATIMLAIAEKRDVVFPRRSYRAIRYQQLLLPLRRKAKKLLAPLRGH